MTDQELREKAEKIAEDSIDRKDFVHKIVELCHQYADGKLDEALQGFLIGIGSGFPLYRIGKNIAAFKSHQPKEKT